MADERNDRQSGSGARPLELSGDSPELVAFALLRYLAQLEQQQDERIVFDRTWMLDAYADCLEAAQGKRKRSATIGKTRSAA